MNNNPHNHRLRIAMLSTHSCPTGNLGARDTGGMSVYIKEMAKEMGKLGYAVDVFTRFHDSDEEQIVPLGENARLIHLRAGDGEGIYKLAIYPYLPEFACNLESFRSKNKLHYDLVFSHYWLSGWVGEYAQCWWEAPHVMMFHTLSAVKNAVGIGEDEPDLRFATEKTLAENARLVIAATEREKADLIRYYGTQPDNISIIPCGVNLEMFRLMDKAATRRRLKLANEKVILFVGRIEPLKGIDLLLKAMASIQNYHNLRLLIVGGDEQSRDEIKRLEELSQELRIEDSVTFQGIVKHEELPVYYNAADVCVVPSYYETFGLVALESLACGTPVVSSDVGGAMTVIRQGETGYVVADNNPQNLAEKIEAILSGQSPLKSSSEIRQSITGFSWAQIAQKTVERFVALIKEPLVAGSAEGRSPFDRGLGVSPNF